MSAQDIKDGNNDNEFIFHHFCFTHAPSHLVLTQIIDMGHKKPSLRLNLGSV